MKNTRKLFSVLALLLAVITLFTACGGKKTAPTAKTFKKVVAEYDLDVQEAGEDVVHDAKEAYFAYNSDGSFVAVYALIENESDAKDAFEEASDSMVEEGAKTKKGSNYQLCEYKGDDGYGYVILIEKTIVVVMSDQANEEDAKALIKDLGL